MVGFQQVKTWCVFLSRLLLRLSSCLLRFSPASMKADVYKRQRQGRRPFGLSEATCRVRPLPGASAECGRVGFHLSCRGWQSRQSCPCLLYTSKAYLKQSTVRQVRPHALRHTFATTCLQAGCDVKTVSYTHLDVYKRQVDYSEKLTEILRSNDIQSVTILRMEVPCCGGLEMAAKKALQTSGKFIPWQVVTISIDGKILD